MAFGYLVLAVVLAVTLNAQNRWLRPSGTALTALALFMIVLLIVLADINDTFAAVPANAPLFQRSNPAILNIQAVFAFVAIPFLGWSAWQQTRRSDISAVPVMNKVTDNGRISNYFHWSIAVVILSLVPIGLLMAMLPTSCSERAAFVGAHQELGLTIFLLAALRIACIVLSPPAALTSGTVGWEASAVRSVHGLLYLLLLLLPVSGYVVSTATGSAIDVFGWTFPVLTCPGDKASSISEFLHNGLLPLLFYVAIAALAGAVLNRHFGEGRKTAVRRMFR